ncbi:glutathione peroxidase [Sporocytophaga myxococcoides]|uniref:Glutathione peroxidase n=1 Tax=Sporocytophaga myxococcoides TaxID=153721 RepID=A0A098LI45_9BACT|nr:glutathione peroxidase [Sporocytophaga myxococcoides]GAL86671.1 glutathione peroxidase [Sporocytophaga myxococcoides]
MRLSLKFSIVVLTLTFIYALPGCGQIKSKPSDGKDAFFSFYSLKANTLEGDSIDFSKFKGKKVLIVNTASKCGYTHQYSELQKLHETHGDKVVILGFPSNDFFNQEPGNSAQIREFCTANFGVTFQMMEKVTVKGKGQHPVFEWLSVADKNGWNDQAPKWNFCKYLINENGELVKFFPSGSAPMGFEITEAISK